MSRTDAHAPFHIRVVRREISVVAVHRCAGGDCDLPALVPGWPDRGGDRCRWEFAFTGTNVCCCWMCHWCSRPEQPRAAVRAALRGVAHAWNAGDDDAGWEG